MLTVCEWEVWLFLVVSQSWWVLNFLAEQVSHRYKQWRNTKTEPSVRAGCQIALLRASMLTHCQPERMNHAVWMRFVPVCSCNPTQFDSVMCPILEEIQFDEDYYNMEMTQIHERRRRQLGPGPTFVRFRLRFVLRPNKFYVSISSRSRVVRNSLQVTVINPVSKLDYIQNAKSDKPSRRNTSIVRWTLWNFWWHNWMHFFICVITHSVTHLKVSPLSAFFCIL